MEINVTKFSRDIVEFSVSSDLTTVDFKIVKDPTRRDHNLEDLYFTTFVEDVYSYNPVEECKSSIYQKYLDSINSHPYLTSEERVVFLNTGIREVDSLPIALGPDYGRVYYFPYPGTHIDYSGVGYSIIIGDKRLSIACGVHGMLHYVVRTITKDDIRRLLGPTDEEIKFIDNLFGRGMSLFNK